MTRYVIFGSVGLFLSVQSPAALAQTGNAPEGLSASDWSSIRAAYEQNRHAAFAVDGGWLARNPGQQWRTRFDGRGFVTTPDAGGWAWGLELVSFGRVDSPSRAGVEPSRDREGAGSQPACVDVVGERISYQWDDNLSEWYVNGTGGLEHGYTVHRRPEASRGEGVPPVTHRSDADATSRLHFTLAVRGDLTPGLNADRRGVTFLNAAGAAAVNYAGLKVVDAAGAEVPAWFEETASFDGRDARATHSVQPAQFIGIVVNDAQAVYPLTIDPIAQQAYLKASNTGASDEFGYSVAASGDTVVIGALFEASNATGVNGNQADNSANGSGAAYVFVRSGGVWTQQAYLKASNAEEFDLFGYSVAVSGDTVVVGAANEDSSATGVNGNEANNSTINAGAAYVFVRSGTVWSQQAYLKASNPGSADLFGQSVAVSGDTVVVGAAYEDSSATGVNGNQADNSSDASGAAYVFVRSGGVWSQQAYLKASNTGAVDFFGYSVAASDDTVLVGAKGEASNATGVNGNGADNSANSSGAAYVFVRSGGAWSQQAYLKASNTGTSDDFGWSVAISGDTVVVGALAEDSIATGVNGNQADNSAAQSGAAYVFVRSGGVWSQQAYLKASNTATNDVFGRSVAVSGDTVVVGADGEDSNATGVNGNQADNSAVDSGAAYVFVRRVGVWSQQAYLKASNTGTSDEFGWSVAISGDTVVVGAVTEASNATGVNGNQADNSATASGAAYVFELSHAIVYVNAGATGANDGTSWTNAYTSLQSALFIADPGDQIWVAWGMYKPSSPTGRSATFKPVNGVAIYGGFRGLPGDEGVNNATTRPPDPDPATANPATDSILSGDLNGDDGANFANYGDNCYNILTGNGAGATAILDGFTITGGNADGVTPFDDGGGLNINSITGGGSPTIRNCRFLSNSAAFGGGLFIDNGISNNSIVEGCLFQGNRATTFYGGAVFTGTTNQPTLNDSQFKGNTATDGGAIFSRNSFTLTNCLFDNNSAGGEGGAICSNGGMGTIVGCTFTGNHTTSAPGGTPDDGGAIFAITSTIDVWNSKFIGSSAAELGGAIFLWTNASATLTNCLLNGTAGTTIFCHTGSLGATLRNSTIVQSGGNVFVFACGIPVTLRNCIVWGNGGTIFNSSCGAEVAYSDIQEVYPGTGNINADPLFVDPDGPNNIPGTDDDDLHLQSASPCVEAGDPAFVPLPNAPTDIDGQPRILACRVDMGFDEFTLGLAHSGDMDASGTVTAADVSSFVVVLLHGGSSVETCVADMDGDGAANGNDIQPFVYALLQ